MQTTYAQKNETTQRAADNTAAAVHDNSPQSESLQRKAALCNAPIQCYGMDDGFTRNHSARGVGRAIKTINQRAHARETVINSVLTNDAQDTLNRANGGDGWIRRVPCFVWYYNFGHPYYESDCCAVLILDGRMHHVQDSPGEGDEMPITDYSSL